MGCRLILTLCQAYHRPEGFNTSRSHTGSIWAATSRGIHFRHTRPITNASTPGPSLAFRPGHGSGTETGIDEGSMKIHIFSETSGLSTSDPEEGSMELRSLTSRTNVPL